MKNRPALIACALLLSALLAPSTSRARPHRHDTAAAAAKSVKYPSAQATLASMRMDRPPRTSFEVNCGMVL